MSEKEQFPDIDIDLARLNEIRDLLTTVTDANERSRLATEQTVIRLRWRTDPLSSMSDQRLTNYIETLVDRIAYAQDHHIPVSRASTRWSDGLGMDARAIVEHNAKVSENFDLAGLIRQRDEATTELAARH